VFNDGAMISLSKDRVEPSANPDAWFLHRIFIAGMTNRPAKHTQPFVG
jgi:hypothetical protein